MPIKLLGADDGAWRLTGLDPGGLDLACGDATLAPAIPTARHHGTDDLRTVHGRLGEGGARSRAVRPLDFPGGGVIDFSPACALLHDRRAMFAYLLPCFVAVQCVPVNLCR